MRDCLEPNPFPESHVVGYVLESVDIAVFPELLLFPLEQRLLLLYRVEYVQVPRLFLRRYGVVFCNLSLDSLRDIN